MIETLSAQFREFSIPFVSLRMINSILVKFFFSSFLSLSLSLFLTKLMSQILKTFLKKNIKDHLSFIFLKKKKLSFNYFISFIFFHLSFSLSSFFFIIIFFTHFSYTFFFFFGFLLFFIGELTQV